MVTTLLIIALVVMTVLFVKAKLSLYVLTRWITEKKYPLPDEQDMEHLAEKVTDKWFKKN